MMTVTAGQALGILVLIAAVVVAALILRRPMAAAQGDGRANSVQARSMRESFGMPEPAEDSDVQGGYCTPTEGGGVAWQRYRSRGGAAAGSAGGDVVFNNYVYDGQLAEAPAPSGRVEPATERTGMGREPALPPREEHPPADIHTRPEEVVPRREEHRPPEKQPKAPRLDPNAGQGKIKILFPIAGVEYRIFPRTMEQNPQRQTGEKNEQFGQLASGVSELEIEEVSLFPGEWGVEYRDAQGNVSRFWKFTVN